jgi:hypothetical protein
MGAGLADVVGAIHDLNLRTLIGAQALNDASQVDYEAR